MQVAVTFATTGFQGVIRRSLTVLSTDAVDIKRGVGNLGLRRVGRNKGLMVAFNDEPNADS